MGLESKTPFILAASMLLVIVFLLIVRTNETVVNDPEENQKIRVDEHSGDEADESKTTTD